MKLSEVLGWLKKRTLDEPYHIGFNDALTSCDREIDREALANRLRIFFNSEMDKDSNDISEDGIDKFISNMPTWLKRIEDK